jgi:hypothetical protein
MFSWYSHVDVLYSLSNQFLIQHAFVAGILLILTTRDGDNRILPLAWVICLKENAPNYEYFAKHCKKVKGLQPYLDRAQHLLYSDRHKGIPAFQRCFKCGTADCVNHLLTNCRDHCSSKGGKTGFHKNQIYDLQREFTLEGYQRALDKLSRGFPMAAEWFHKLVHKETFLYAILERGFTTHGHQTSNIAEIMNSVLK